MCYILNLKKMWFLKILDFIEIRNASSVIYIP